MLKRIPELLQKKSLKPLDYKIMKHPIIITSTGQVFNRNSHRYQAWCLLKQNGWSVQKAMNAQMLVFHNQLMQHVNLFQLEEK